MPVLQARRDKLAFFERHCSEVADGLMVAGGAVASDLSILTASRVSHILNCVGALLPCSFPDSFAYKVLYLQGGLEPSSCQISLFSCTLLAVSKPRGSVLTGCCEVHLVGDILQHGLSSGVVRTSSLPFRSRII